MQRAGWLVEPYEVIIKASTIVAYHAGVSCTVGRGWYARFAKRHHELAPRVAKNLNLVILSSVTARNAVTEDSITRFFFDLVKGCLGFRCTVADVYNVDETSFKTKGKNKKVVAIRGSKSVWRTDQNESYHLTVVAAVAADGTPVPPAFILTGASCAATEWFTCDALLPAAGGPNKRHSV
ncbi:Aste57867_3279 [Aphanomyces stellatus]|uniref:Aste57867_3279 protein n=1 Tax=Aphanomyces stellatus TaxID=120398 RepID=A0A485KD74_9STRA|nr:hypothetical protein As57867_003269 [Aphanomyces stellatus]VFT80451.1 Aste57867_3279 [Aphanomyces stellatus]